MREQLRVAADLPLPLHQAQIRPWGIVIECRINTEDLDRNFEEWDGSVSLNHPGALIIWLARIDLSRTLPASVAKCTGQARSEKTAQCARTRAMIGFKPSGVIKVSRRSG